MKFAPFAHDLHSPNKRSSRSGNAHAFVAVRRHGCGDCMGKTQVCARSSQARGDPFRHPRDAIDDCVYWLAPFGDSALGGPLSLLCFRSWESAFYFSAARYATVGYGDVVLPRTWRTLGPVESIIGVLMCGLSAS